MRAVLLVCMHECMSMHTCVVGGASDLTRPHKRSVHSCCKCPRCMTCRCEQACNKHRMPSPQEVTSNPAVGATSVDSPARARTMVVFPPLGSPTTRTLAFSCETQNGPAHKTRVLPSARRRAARFSEAARLTHLHEPPLHERFLDFLEHHSEAGPRAAPTRLNGLASGTPILNQ